MPPPSPNWPAGHWEILVVGEVAPGPHWLPGVAPPREQFPVHAGEVSPVALPYVPGGHGVQGLAPPRPKVPMGQVVFGPRRAVAPGPQELPRAAVQALVHRALARPVAFPKRPSGQGVQGLPPPSPNWPTGHREELLVGEVAPGPHWLPGLAAQGLQPTVMDSPVTLEYVPAGQGVHTDEDALEYCPRAQGAQVDTLAG